MRDQVRRLEQARQISRDRFGRRITFFLPGMFSLDGVSGKYPAISITGTNCALNCNHCRGILLHSMIPAEYPPLLIEKCLHLSEKGNHGVLISGGCDKEGRLPWKDFTPAIEEIKEKTDLFVSVHSGFIDYTGALRLKEAGVDQALIDVIGDDETYLSICHVRAGVSWVLSSLESLNKAALPVVPHIVCGIHNGKIKGEKRAVEMISRFDVEQVVIVSLMQLPGADMPNVTTPPAEEIADIIVEARFRMPDIRISLGCARQRGNTDIELLAIEAGVNRMAIPSEEAIKRAEDYGLEIKYQRTCCSVSKDFSGEKWKQ